MKKQVFKSYADKISTLYDIRLESLFEKNKIRKIVDARYMLYYLCKERNMKIIQIKSFMQEQGYETAHTTIIYGIKVVEQNKKIDQDYEEFINNINNELQLTRCFQSS